MYATLDTAVIKPLRILQSVLCKYLNCGAFVRGVFIMRGFGPGIFVTRGFCPPTAFLHVSKAFDRVN